MSKSKRHPPTSLSTPFLTYPFPYPVSPPLSPRTLLVLDVQWGKRGEWVKKRKRGRTKEWVRRPTGPPHTTETTVLRPPTTTTFSSSHAAVPTSSFDPSDRKMNERNGQDRLFCQHRSSFLLLHSIPLLLFSFQHICIAACGVAPFFPPPVIPPPSPFSHFHHARVGPSSSPSICLGVLLHSFHHRRCRPPFFFLILHKVGDRRMGPPGARVGDTQAKPGMEGRKKKAFTRSLVPSPLKPPLPPSFFRFWAKKKKPRLFPPCTLPLTSDGRTDGRAWFFPFLGGEGVGEEGAFGAWSFLRLGRSVGRPLWGKAPPSCSGQGPPARDWASRSHPPVRPPLRDVTYAGHFSVVPL